MRERIALNWPALAPGLGERRDQPRQRGDGAVAGAGDTRRRMRRACASRARAGAASRPGRGCARGRRPVVGRAANGGARGERPRRAISARPPPRASSSPGRCADRSSRCVFLRAWCGSERSRSRSGSCCSFRRSGRLRKEQSSSCARGRSSREGLRPASTSEGGSPAKGCTLCSRDEMPESSAGGVGSVALPIGCVRMSSERWPAGRRASGEPCSRGSCSVRTRA